MADVSTAAGKPVSSSSSDGSTAAPAGVPVGSTTVKRVKASDFGQSASLLNQKTTSSNHFEKSSPTDQLSLVSAGGDPLVRTISPHLGVNSSLENRVVLPLFDLIAGMIREHEALNHAGGGEHSIGNPSVTGEVSQSAKDGIRTSLAILATNEEAMHALTQSVLISHQEQLLNKTQQTVPLLFNTHALPEEGISHPAFSSQQAITHESVKIGSEGVAAHSVPPSQPFLQVAEKLFQFPKLGLNLLQQASHLVQESPLFSRSGGKLMIDLSSRYPLAELGNLQHLNSNPHLFESVGTSPLNLAHPGPLSANLLLQALAISQNPGLLQSTISQLSVLRGLIGMVLFQAFQFQLTPSAILTTLAALQSQSSRAARTEKDQKRRRKVGLSEKRVEGKEEIEAIEPSLSTEVDPRQGKQSLEEQIAELKKLSEFEEKNQPFFDEEEDTFI